MIFFLYSVSVRIQLVYGVTTGTLHGSNAGTQESYDFAQGNPISSFVVRMYFDQDISIPLACSLTIVMTSITNEVST